MFVTLFIKYISHREPNTHHRSHYPKTQLVFIRRNILDGTANSSIYFRRLKLPNLHSGSQDKKMKASLLLKKAYRKRIRILAERLFAIGARRSHDRASREMVGCLWSNESDGLSALLAVLVRGYVSLRVLQIRLTCAWSFDAAKTDIACIFRKCSSYNFPYYFN